MGKVNVSDAILLTYATLVAVFAVPYLFCKWDEHTPPGQGSPTKKRFYVGLILGTMIFMLSYQMLGQFLWENLKKPRVVWSAKTLSRFERAWQDAEIDRQKRALYGNSTQQNDIPGD